MTMVESPGGVQLLPTCLCGSMADDAERIHRIPILRCRGCGVVRQIVPMTQEQLSEWYRDRYFQGIYQHDYDHDYDVAQQRLRAYHLPESVRLLDVGSGNGAFVAAARDAGLDAWGQDLASQSEGPYVYVGALHDVAFPTDDFDIVTVHDVLEHLPDPLAALREIRRVLRPGGKLLVDFPRFHHEAGKHHWKLIEHVWCLDVEQLLELIKSAGFVVRDWSFPIPSKVAVTAECPQEQRPQILVPAGIGDAYWVLVKLPGFLRARKLGLPDIWVQDQGGPRRTVPFLRTIPFINAAGYKESGKGRIFHEAYMTKGRTIFTNVEGVDYFIAYNGVMRFGVDLKDADPEFGCAWAPRMHISKEAQAMQARLVASGPYALCYFASSGMYSAWIAEFGADKIWNALDKLNRELGLRIVFMGAEWDRGSLGDLAGQRDARWLNLIGQTTYDQMLGAIRGASLVFGWPAGNTLLGLTFGIPTVLVWNQYFVSDFWRNAAPPNTPYRTLDSRGLTPEAVVAAAREVMGL